MPNRYLAAATIPFMSGFSLGSVYDQQLRRRSQIGKRKRLRPGVNEYRR